MRTFLVVGLTAIVSAAIHAQSDRARGQYTVAYASFGPVATALYVADADGSHERPVARGVDPRHEPLVHTGRPVGDLHGAAQRVGRHLSRQDRWVWPRAPHR